MSSILFNVNPWLSGGDDTDVNLLHSDESPLGWRIAAAEEVVEEGKAGKGPRGIGNRVRGKRGIRNRLR